MSRPLFNGKYGDRAQSAVDQFHPNIVTEVKAAVDRDAVVVIGMAWNPHVANVRKALDEAGISFTYLEYGSYVSKWKERLAIKMWSGWPTFPQVYVNGTLVGGNARTRKMLEDGSFKALIEAGRTSDEADAAS